MNESSLTSDSPLSTSLLLKKMRDLDERVSRVEAHLQLVPAAKFVDPIAKPVEAAPSTSLFASGVARPISPTSPGPTGSPTPDREKLDRKKDEPTPPISALPISALPISALPISLPPSATVPITPPTSPDVAARVSPEIARPVAASPEPAFSLGEWENLIGGKWALWVGSLCLFLAMASFLAYTWRSLPPAPPWAKVAMGLGSGLALLVAGGWLRTRTQRYFSEGISGAGLSICYLSLWAGGQYFSVLSHTQSFLGMAILTGIGVALAVRTDALILSVLSTLGGFLTPILLQSGGGSGHATPFLTYVALLDAGILATSLYKRWRGLVWLSFAGTILLVGGWAPNANLAAVRGPFFLFLSLYFLMFLGASSFYGLIRDEETAPQDLVLLFAATSLYALAGYGLLYPISGSFPGAFPIALAAFFGLMNVLVIRLAPRNFALRYSAGGLALLGLTVAAPLQLHQAALTIGWVMEAAVLLFLGGRLNSPLLRRAGQSVWVLTAIPLLSDLSAPATAHPGFFSAAALPLAVCVAVSAFIAWNARKRAETAAERDELEASYAVFSTLGGAWLLGQEIFRFFQWHHAPKSSDWTANAYFAVAGAVAIYALLIYLLGLKWRHETTRFCTIVLGIGSAMGAVWTAFSLPLAIGVPLWNARAAAFLVTGGVLALLSRLMHGESDALSAFEKQNAPGWITGTAFFGIVAASLELYFDWPASRIFWGFERDTARFFALSMLWSIAATLLLYLGCRWRQLPLRALALLVGGLSGMALLGNSLLCESVGLPWLNGRFVAFAVALAALILSANILRRNQSELHESEQQLPTIFRFLALGILLWSLTQESYALSHYAQAMLGTNWQRWGQMLVSLVWSLFGALLLLCGIGRRQQSLRLAALGLLFATVVKVFLFDLGFLNGPSRALSLGGLGLSLVFISWLYSRFGTEKRGGGNLSGAP